MASEIHATTRKAMNGSQVSAEISEILPAEALYFALAARAATAKATARVASERAVARAMAPAAGVQS